MEKKNNITLSKSFLFISSFYHHLVFHVILGFHFSVFFLCV